MKVTLNRAIKYRDQLQSEIRAKSLPVMASISYSSEEQLEAEFSKANALVLDSLAKVIDANDALTDLRNLIGEANQESGVSNIMTRIGGYTKSINILENRDALYSSKTYEEAIISFKNAKEREEKDPTNFVGIVTTSVKTLTSSDEENIETTIKNLRKEIEALKEERNTINLTTQIELPEKIVSALKWAAVI